MSANDISLIAGALVLVIGSLAAAAVAIMKAMADLKKAASENMEALTDQSHNHKVALALQIQETKEMVEETKGVAIQAKAASEKAEREANQINLKIRDLGLEHNILQRRDIEEREKQNDKLDKDKK